MAPLMNGARANDLNDSWFRLGSEKNAVRLEAQNVKIVGPDTHLLG